MHQYPEDLLSGIVTAPSRIRNYLNQGDEKKLLPQSCELREYNNYIVETAILISQGLRGGAGVKLILDQYEQQEPLQFNWKFRLSENHLDFSKITEYQNRYLLNKDWGAWVERFDLSWINVGDSMEESTYEAYPLAASSNDPCSIEESWKIFYELAKQGKDIVVDLSNLRPCGTTNDKGLTATGPVGNGLDEANESSFLAIYDYLARYLTNPSILSLLQFYGALNGTLRRGGLYKNGIITSSMSYDSPYIEEYLNTPLLEIPGSHKKGVEVDSGVLDNEKLCDLIVEKVNSESVFLGKKQQGGEHWNVCNGISLKHGGTCLIWRVNLGLCETPEDIPEAFVEATKHLCNLHINWRNEVGDRAKNYLSLEDDRQVGLDVLGFANFLANQGITYKEFCDELEAVFTDPEFCARDSKAYDIVSNLIIAYTSSTAFADEFMDQRGLPRLERIHTIEPSQSHAYECKDINGYTTARSIFAPFGRKTRRKSETMKSKQKVYNHGNVEVATDLGPDLHQHFCELWQRMMNQYGKPHGISFDILKKIDRKWFDNFIRVSPLQTLYYNFSEDYDQSYLRKRATIATAEEEAVTCSLENKGACQVCGE